ncbi:MAG: hypothetical protein JW731_09060 [Bacteroidales bacterium]|nr:hypothetical protein [Bacteroidales bacterium]
MKTINVIVYVLSAILIVAAVSGFLLFNDYQKDQNAKIQSEETRNDALSIKLHQRDSLVNDYLATFNEIDSALRYIKEQEKLLGAQSKDVEFAGDSKKQIVKDIQMVNDLIAKNKEKIADLNKKLKQSGIEIKSLNDKLLSLSQTIEERDRSIEALTAEISKRDQELGELSEIIAKVEDSVQTQKKIIDYQTNQLNKAYIAYGNYKELKEKNILTKDGGFLGLGKIITLNDDLSKDYFTEVDITKAKSFPVFSKEAELITEHPAGSYEWVTENDTITYMMVLNPDEFWKISKYAVVETK